MSHLSGLITINIPPGEDIVGNDTDVVYIENGITKGDDNFRYLYGTANPTVQIGGSTATTPGTLRLGGANGSGVIDANSITATANNGLIFDTSGGPGNTLFKSLVTINGVATDPNSTLALASANPVLEFNRTTGSANMKIWKQYVDGSGNLFTLTNTDAGAVGQNAIQITRTGTTVTSHRMFLNNAICFALDNTGITVTGNVNPTGGLIAASFSAAANPAAIASITNSGVISFAGSNLGGITLFDASQPVNARSCDIINYQGGVRFRLKNDAGGNVIEPLAFLGGYAGYTGALANAGNGTWSQIATVSTYASPMFQLYSNGASTNEPLLFFNATQSGTLADRRRWYISGKNGNFLNHGISNDNGTQNYDAYQIYRGTNTVGGHNWFVGTGGDITAGQITTMSLTATALSILNGTVLCIGSVSPHPSAALDIQSTTQGFSLPSMTSAQRNSIVNPADGLLVYDPIAHDLYVYKNISGNAGWKVVTTTP